LGFVIRTCSKAAVGHQTNVEIEISGEGFSTQGLMITETNWLDVYPWEKWGGNANLPRFQVLIGILPRVHLKMSVGCTVTCFGKNI
jgi:DNA topoisomerase-3